MARTLFPTRPQYPVARCCLLPAILLEASNLYAIISALDLVVSMSSRSSQSRIRQRFWFGKCRLVRTEYPFGVTLILKLMTAQVTLVLTTAPENINSGPAPHQLSQANGQSHHPTISGSHEKRSMIPPMVSMEKFVICGVSTDL